MSTSTPVSGRLLRRLEALEDELASYKSQCQDLQNRCNSLEKWKIVVEKWAFDMFGNEIWEEEEKIQDSQESTFTANETKKNTTDDERIMIVPLTIPKIETEDHEPTPIVKEVRSLTNQESLNVNHENESLQSVEPPTDINSNCNTDETTVDFESNIQRNSQESESDTAEVISSVMDSLVSEYERSNQPLSQNSSESVTYEGVSTPIGINVNDSEKTTDIIQSPCSTSKTILPSTSDGSYKSMNGSCVTSSSTSTIKQSESQVTTNGEISTSLNGPTSIIPEKGFQTPLKKNENDQGSNKDTARKPSFNSHYKLTVKNTPSSSVTSADSKNQTQNLKRTEFPTVDISPLKKRKTETGQSAVTPEEPTVYTGLAMGQDPSSSRASAATPNDHLVSSQGSFDTTPCAVCYGVESEPMNEMVFCDSCNVCVHQACYGIKIVPEGKWFCNPCATQLKPDKLSCYFCPNKGGALKPVQSPSKNKWAHVTCALWIPEVTFGKPDKMEPVINVNKIDSKRWKLKCSLCNVKEGACIQCQFSRKCTTAFHVTCAFKEGLRREEIDDDTHPDGIILRAFCKHHSGPVDDKNTKRTPKKSRRGGSQSPMKKKNKHFNHF